MISENQKYYDWFEHLLKVRNYADKTKHIYMFHIKRFLDRLEKPLENCIATELEFNWIQMKEAKAKNTLRNMQISLKFFFKEVHKSKSDIPDVFKDQKSIKEDIVEPNIPTHEEIQRIALSAWIPTGKSNIFQFIALRNAAIVVFLADTGLRVSECVQVRFADIYTRENRYEVNVPRIKDSPGRIVPFGYLNNGALVGEIFSKYFMTMKYQYKFKDSDPLFPTTKDRNAIVQDRPLTTQSVGVIVKNAAVRASVKHVHPHLFRHYYGTYSMINGVSLVALKGLMGHRMVSTTERYVHLADRMAHTFKYQPTRDITLPKSLQGAAEMQKELMIRENKRG